MDRILVIACALVLVGGFASCKDSSDTSDKDKDTGTDTNLDGSTEKDTSIQPNTDAGIDAGKDAGKDTDTETDTIDTDTVDTDTGTGPDATCAEGLGKLDSDTNLCWLLSSSDKKYNWEQAIEYCYDLVLGGYEDWILPTRQNYIDIFDNCDPATVLLDESGYCSSCEKSAKCSFLLGAPTEYNWTSSHTKDERMWVVVLGLGRIFGYPTSQRQNVRCTRQMDL